MAHEIPYVATATVSELRDLEYKSSARWSSAAPATCTCTCRAPLGWGAASRDTIRIARLAKETGMFPVFEAVDGEVVGVSKIRRAVPVEVLELRSAATRTCSQTTATEVIARIQAIADTQDPALRPASPGRRSRPAAATDAADLPRDQPDAAGRSEEESNLMRLLAETHHGAQ